ncbi:uncharacterized protein qrfp [Clinocottus analis]|uniref:uncharacterized protein qrfp n=1 Tax=Clinocottus analis TaxID=304258 RepID=UPI0035C0A328
MRLSFRLGASELALLFLTLLFLVPWAATSSPHDPTAPPKSASPEGASPEGASPEGAPLESAPLAERSRDPRSAMLRPMEEEEEEEVEEEEESETWEEEVLVRAQRGDLAGRPLSPFPASLSLEGLNYQEGGDGEEGGRRKEALTSIAGGLQAVSREKGGFGFRFGRKRWSDRG